MRTIASASLRANAINHVAAVGQVDKTAARAGMTIVAWMGFATLLSQAIWRRDDPSVKKIADAFSRRRHGQSGGIEPVTDVDVLDD